MEEVRLYKRSEKGLKTLGLTAALVAMGVWLVSKDSGNTASHVIGWVCICFFGLGIPVGLFQTLDRRPQIIITENGIWDRTIRRDEIKWEHIKRAYPLNVYKQQFVSLVVEDANAMQQPSYQWADRLNEAIGAQKINLSVSQLRIDAQQLSVFINAIIASEKRDRRSLLKKYFGH